MTFEQYLMCLDLLAGEGYGGREDLLKRAPLLTSPNPHPAYEWLIPAARHFKRVSDALGGAGSFPRYLGTDGLPDLAQIRADLTATFEAPFPYVLFVFQEHDSPYDYETPQAVEEIRRSSTRQVLESHAHALAYLWLSDILAAKGRRAELGQLQSFFESNSVGPYRPFRLLFNTLTTREAAQVYCALCDLALNPAIPATRRTTCDSRFFDPTARLAQYAYSSFQNIMPTRGLDRDAGWHYRVLESLHQLVAQGGLDVSLTLPHIAQASRRSDGMFAYAEGFRNMLESTVAAIAEQRASVGYVRPLQRWSDEYYRTASQGATLRQHRPLLLGTGSSEEVLAAIGMLGWPTLVSQHGSTREIWPRELLVDWRDNHWFGTGHRDPRVTLHVPDWISMLDRLGHLDGQKAFQCSFDHGPEDPNVVFKRFALEYDENRGRSLPILRPFSEVVGGLKWQR
ncbi:hypothetical protein [Micromonospora craterilacus]|uniref:hypothetical protein n=1 Tax=Micromonospora craterilacus TaxID=1655439 RepID=UPI0011B7EE3E|nr:hypothetical protein [Micromonospora craterilacus]